MRRSTILAVISLLVVVCADAKQVASTCGTYRGRAQAELAIHRRAQAMRRLSGAGGARMSTGAQAAVAAGGTVFAARPDAGDIAIIEASDGVLFPVKQFDQSMRTLTFTPVTAAAGQYRYLVNSAPGYDAAAASAGVPVALADDAAAPVNIGFTFAFFGKSYNSLYLNSDGNLTFGAPEYASTERSLGRMHAGPPRISPLFDDLDPSAANASVRVNSTPAQLIISWVNVPEWQPSGSTNPQTFQVRLFPDGRIEFAWGTVSPTSAVVGIGPGNLEGGPAVVDFSVQGGTYTSLVAELFSSTASLDFLAVAQRFYATHDDAYDYLVIFNGLGMPDSASSLASTRIVRNAFTGNGDVQVDMGREFGSPSRLQAVIHMAYPGQYPEDLLQARMRYTDTPIGILAHETGHLWLAYATTREPDNANALSLLGGQLAHWSFNFNSLASLLEGNTIEDHNDGTFRTIDATHRFSPLDQYLMGLRPAWDVRLEGHDLFRVADSTTISGNAIPNTRLPQTGVDMRGFRTNVAIEDIMAANGRRTPDHTVSQKRFRFGFIYIVPAGAQPAQADLDKINRFRTLFEPYFSNAADSRAIAETTLKRAMHVSTFPAAGVVAGSTATATIAVESAPQSDLRVDLANNGLIRTPAYVTIPAGETRAMFTFQGLRGGVDELTAAAGDSSYETVRSNVQVLDSAAGLRIAVVSGGNQTAIPGGTLAEPLVLRVVDQNNLPYPGVQVTTTVAGGGTLAPQTAATDESGYVRFWWTTGTTSLNEVRATIAGAASSTTAIYAWGPPVFAASGVVSAASWLPDLAPGGLASLFGNNMAPGEASGTQPLPESLLGTSVLVNGVAAPLLWVSPLQINFQVPPDIAPGPATVQVNTVFGNTQPVTVNAVSEYAPGIFDDPHAGAGAILVAGQSEKTNIRPAHPGEFVEIYCTGLGELDTEGLTLIPVQVYIGGNRMPEVTYAGVQPEYVGLNQVNVRIPPDLAPGRYPVYLEMNGKRSNIVDIEVR